MSTSIQRRARPRQTLGRRRRRRRRQQQQQQPAAQGATRGGAAGGGPADGRWEDGTGGSRRGCGAARRETAERPQGKRCHNVSERCQRQPLDGGLERKISKLTVNGWTADLACGPSLISSFFLSFSCRWASERRQMLAFRAAASGALRTAALLRPAMARGARAAAPWPAGAPRRPLATEAPKPAAGAGKAKQGGQLASRRTTGGELSTNVKIGRQQTSKKEEEKRRRRRRREEEK